MTMEERMTLCNMSIEGGARAGYVNPDETTFAYLRGRRFAPAGEAFDRAAAWWRSIASDADAAYDDGCAIDGAALAPMVTWGINPGQSRPVDGRVPGAGGRGRRRARRRARRARVHGARGGRADRGHARRRGVHRLVHERAAVGPARGRARRAGPAGRGARARARRAGLEAGGRGRRARRACTRSSARPGSSGGRPAARCAWR